MKHSVVDFDGEAPLTGNRLLQNSMTTTSISPAIVPMPFMDRFRATMFVRLWSLSNVWLIFLVRPSVVELSATRCVIRIPLNWLTRNHLKVMYIGALVVGADVTGGLIAMRMIQKRKARVALLFKDFRAEFFKRADGDVWFRCEDGPTIASLVERAVETGERQEGTVTVVATVPEKSGDEPVARFELTLTLKRRD